MLRNKNDMIISFLVLRQLIGFLGILLPFACILGGYAVAGLGVQSSISIYYYTNMRDIFAGLLILVGVFLITYYGYELIDTIVNTATGIAGLGIALFPCLNSADPATRTGIFMLMPSVSNAVHLVCASSFFILLAFTSLFLFTRSGDKESMTPRKKIRNRIYRICGSAIIFCVVLMAAVLLFVPEGIRLEFRLTFILETIMLISFGISWIVKGEALLKDS